MLIEIVAWKQDLQEAQGVTYTVQTKSKTQREVKSIFSQKHNWILAGEGFDGKNKEYLFIFKKTFPNKESWLKFAKGLDHDVEEISQRTGRRKLLNGRRKSKSKRAARG